MLSDEFWRYYLEDAKTGCWNWTRSKANNGYGHAIFRGKLVGAHRIAYTIAFGQIPPRMFVIHDCDNPSCINPKHLSIGNQKKNLSDAASRGRMCSGDRNGTRKHPEALRRGSRHRNAKLDEEQVRQIFVMAHFGVSHKRIAACFDVSMATVSDIKSQKHWKHATNRYYADYIKSRLAAGVGAK